MKRMSRLADLMSNGSGLVAGWLGIILMGLVLVEVITRYILQSPLTIADEVGAYMLVAITFLGLAYTWKEKGHVRIEVVVTRLPLRLRKRLRIVTLIMATGFVPLLIWASCKLVIYSSDFGVRSSASLRTPLAWPQSVLIIGGLFILLQLIVDLAKAIKAVKAP